MSEEITYSTITNIDDIEILRGKESHGYTYDQESIDMLKDHFTLKDSLYVLAQNGDVFAGFCSIDRDWWEDNYFFLREIIVDTGSQRKGVGGELMRQCIEHAREKGATGVVTETAFDNFRMRGLCEKLGFTEWDNPKWKDGVTLKLIF